jgi:sulfonate transport system substrate-binding protein
VNLVPRTPRRLAVLLVPLVVWAAAACGSDGGTAGASNTDATPTSASSATTGRVPAGTTLRVGDQLDALKLVLGTAGQGKNVPYALKYANFVGGPPMLQAFQAGELDVGYVADTPLIFAQAAKQDIVAVAGWAPERSALRLIVPPGKDISSWKDLKGKKVAYQQGTVLEAVLLKGLKGAGLSLDDVKTVNVPVTQVSAALQSGSVDAAVLAPPLDSAYFAQQPNATAIDAPTDITLRVNFIIASKKALDDPGKAAAIGDYVQRVVRSYGWINANPDAWINAFYVGQYKLPAAQGRKLLDHAGKTTFVALPGNIVPAQQELADLYHGAGEIPQKLDDVSREFDGRYNELVAAAANAAAAK